MKREKIQGTCCQVIFACFYKVVYNKAFVNSERALPMSRIDKTSWHKFFSTSLQGHHNCPYTNYFRPVLPNPPRVPGENLRISAGCSCSDAAVFLREGSSVCVTAAVENGVHDSLSNHFEGL